MRGMRQAGGRSAAGKHRRWALMKACCCPAAAWPPQTQLDLCAITSHSAMGCLLATPLAWAGGALLLLSFGSYFLLQLICGGYFKTQNLKKRYNAKWALVTGSSSGEGPGGGRRCGSWRAPRREALPPCPCSMQAGQAG